MRIAIIAVGKVRQPGFRTEIDDYITRIGRYARCEEVELKDGTEKELIERFRKAIGSRARTIALEVDGAAWTSQRFAGFLGQCENDGVGTVAMLIGGAYGLPKAVSNLADVKLSLSTLTLPHRLARLVLVEQIYRGFTILRNEPYSH
ncbi:MAG: 23S rRNA (pseudouridine(1915)-N(3))-methyltransferase RlmH [Deltaproteobacteria bacterium]|nr:23S rRNA (pseudouridine(1915)-N(3))-methyltransferase RlmH [Deltaproteobacteria bacterium]